VTKLWTPDEIRRFDGIYYPFFTRAVMEYARDIWGVEPTLDPLPENGASENYHPVIAVPSLPENGV